MSLVEGDRVFGDYEEGVMADFRLTAEELDFIAGFLLSWLQGQPVDACLTAGARNAAVTIGYRGAW